MSTDHTSKKKEIGLVLSGGGVRGVAHAGVLKALEENGIRPTQLSGSSAGAMVSALYAAGYTPEDIHRFFRENASIFRWQHFARGKPGFLDAEKYTKMFEPWLHDHTFETLSKKIHICVTDVLAGKIRFFSSGELIYPLLASAAVPGVFTPVEIDDVWYIDGGTMNNFPVEPLLGRCDILLGSFVSPKKKMEKHELNTTLKLISRANDLSFLAASQVKFGLCDFVFIPYELWRFGTFDSKKVDEIYRIGYEWALQKMLEVKELINT
ncbi:MAG: phospholipase [Bacteroidetes bacterium]|nr:MAG: phospholipase [Bacteroidota bacterium]